MGREIDSLEARAVRRFAQECARVFQETAEHPDCTGPQRVHFLALAMGILNDAESFVERELAPPAKTR